MAGALFDCCWIDFRGIRVTGTVSTLASLDWLADGIGLLASVSSTTLQVDVFLTCFVCVSLDLLAKLLQESGLKVA